ncbi:lysine 5,6-aminomutase reactivase ATPase KamC [Effusibacillus pohliae]|uniref:lysine 5,6-aminomutase reactivase ATPase KamC n=1 Tax=Effusibacillus pohliae TaxID=232270 RepID=UPI0003769CD8|nr:hypothetical protein [Effusibacillus pohliae]
MREFLDRETREHLAWDYAWNLFQPMSELGNAYRARLRPYLPAEADRWQADRDDLAQLQTALQDADWADRLQQLLVTLRSIAPLFQQTEAGATLQTGELFKWKQWVWKGRLLDQIVRATTRFRWWPDVDWDAALRILNPQPEWTPTFSLDDAYDPVLRELRLRKRQLQHRIDRARKRQHEELRTRYGRLPNQEREYIWPRDDRQAVERARADEDLLLQGETSWEVIFRVQDRASVLALLQELEQVAEMEEDREQALLETLTRQLALFIDRFRGCEAAWGRLDWLVSCILTAQRLGWSFPIWSEGRWEMKNGFHPLLADTLRQKGRQVTPVSFSLAEGVTVLTGPNMGGKTVALRTAGLLQALAQHGMPVPAEAFWFQPVDRVRFVGGDPQSMENGLSTFGGEISRLADILGPLGRPTVVQRPDRVLLLLDEVGRATNPMEGEALAVGLTRFLHGSEWIVLFATHYAGVAEVAAAEGMLRWRVAGLSDHRIVPADSASVQWESLSIAETMGLPPEIIARSREWLSAIEADCNRRGGRT